VMTFGSLFAGVGGFDLGFERVGMRCLWQVEIDKFCLGVLERHWPDVRRYIDVREVGRRNLGAVDLVGGGFPCQDVSLAGKRAGLAGVKSGLWFEFHRVLEELRPRWVVAENVPGLLSSNGGRDLGIVVQGLAEIGYGVAWRVLDAQHFGVAQRR
jgi:DNA (cytosine-5)-methyltransferase 1